MMGVPAALLEIEFIEGIDLASWRRILEVAGWPPSVPRVSLDHETIAAFLNEGPVSPRLLEALLAIHDLGDEDGQEILSAALSEAGVTRAELPTGLGPRDLAAHLWCQDGDPRCQQALLRAQLTAQERAKRRTFREFAAKEPKNAKQGMEEKLKDALAEWCRQNDLGEQAVVVEQRRAGVVTWQLLHGYATQTPLTLEKGRRVRITFRPMHCGMVRYVTATGRLKISARTVTIADGYRRLIGRIIFGSDDFFSNDRICTLQPLADGAQRALDDHSLGHQIPQASLVEALWERGDNQVLHLRAPDCFQALTDLGISNVEGELIEARLALTLAGKSTRRAKVTIKVPNRVDFNRALYDEALIERYLHDIGITQPEGRRSRNLWVLHPWREPLSAWRAAYPLDIDELVARDVLKPIRLDRVAHPDHPGAGRALEVIEDQEGQLHGISRDRDVPSRLLSPTDVDGLELQIAHLVRHIAERLALVDREPPRELGEGCWSLGAGMLGSVRLAPILLARKPSISPELLAARVRDAAVPPASPVLLAPTREGLPPGLPVVGLRRLLPDSRELLLEVVREMRLWGSVPAIRFAPDDARIVLDRHLRRVWVDGVELPRGEEDPAWFLFLERLSDARGDVVDHESMSQHLPVSREPKKIKDQLKKVIKRAFEAADKGFQRALMSELIPAGAGGYRLGVSIFDPLAGRR